MQRSKLVVEWQRWVRNPNLSKRSHVSFR
jgi:hypothetical protein